MSHYEDRSSSVEDAAIDRLVDGELPEAERRDLLLRLENDPEGWRRCTLAFLEDQAFRKAMAGFPFPSSLPEPATSISLRPRKTWTRRISVAATVLVATFAAGFAAGGMLKASPKVQVARADPGRVEAPADVPQRDEIREVGSFKLVDGSAGESPSRRIPILSGPGLNDQWLRDQPPSIPDYVRGRWERRGYQVEERRRLVSVELEDGRRVSIPVDEVEVDYVGQQPL